MHFSKSVPFAFFLFLSQIVLAQNYSISGIIADQQSNQPLEYASIALLKSADSTLVTGTVSKSNGSFEFNQLLPGKYILKLLFIGYQNKFLPVDLTSLKKVYVGKVGLVPGNGLLNQVTITGEKLNTLNKIDKQSYRADQFESAKGGTAVDVLKNLPSVSVNGEGQISVRGSTGF